MLKPLTAEGRFELADFFATLQGKVWAFVPVIGKDFPAQLGIAVANESGYYPIPEHWTHADSWDEMNHHADELNRAEGLSDDAAARIVCSTMGGRKVA